VDKASIGGVLVGTGLVIAAILMGGSLMMFFNIPGLLVVLGGTFAATSIAFPFDEIKLIVPVSRRVFNDQRNEMLNIAQFMVKAMQVQKRDGPVALENIAEERSFERRSRRG
jgi:chemotaxis protein MotA